MSTISENLKRIRAEIPKNVQLAAAGKGHAASEIKEAISAGVKIVGENYVQEAEEKFREIGRAVKWHLIGHLQKNKAKKAAAIFDMIQTIDSFDLAEAFDKECCKLGKIMPILLELNIAAEPQKNGILPEQALSIFEKISKLTSLKPEGLMTMGPLVENPEDLRGYFRKAKDIFEKIKATYSPKGWSVLSMGMSDSYRIAIEEGANMVRIGTAIFGVRGE